MFKKLQTKWNVSARRLILIIITFALGGSLCGYSGRKLLGYINLEKGILWIIVYIAIVTILWPIAVLLVSIPLGQYSFFKRYLRNMFEKLRGKRNAADKNTNSL